MTLTGDDWKTVCVDSHVPSPTTSEKRSVFRVRLAGVRLDVSLNGVLDCTLLDANSEGFAVVCRERLAIGQLVYVELRYGRELFCGQACVRNVHPPGVHGFRYGLQTCPNERDLRQGLRKIAISAQRARLRREAERRRARPLK